MKMRLRRLHEIQELGTADTLINGLFAWRRFEIHRKNM